MTESPPQLSVRFETTVFTDTRGSLTLGLLRAMLGHDDITKLPDHYAATVGIVSGSIGYSLRVTSIGPDQITDDTPIEELRDSLSVRTYNQLKRENINTVAHLRATRASSLRALRNFNEKSLKEIIEALGRSGFALAPEVEADPSIDAVDTLGQSRRLPVWDGVDAREVTPS